MNDIAVNTAEILEALTVPSLKDILSLLTGVDSRGRTNKAELVSAIQASARESEVLLLASRLETLLPRRHSWFFSLQTSRPQPIGDSKFEHLRGAFEAISQEQTPQANAGTSFVARQFVHDKARNRLYLKFEHRLKSCNWERPTPNATTKELVERPLRHVVVVVVRKLEGAIEIRFDGYKQGLATPREDRLSYISLVRTIKDEIQKIGALFLFGLNLHEAANNLTSKTDAVVAVRHVIRPTPGGEVVLDTGEGSSADDILGLIKKFLGVSIDPKELQLALRNAPTDSVLLMWHKYQLLTRLAFNDIGTELLYIWRHSEKSEEVLDGILNELLRCIPHEKSSLNLTNYVVDAPVGTVFRLSELCQRFNASPESALQELEFLVRENKLNRCYRLRSNKVFHDYVNRWENSLADLPARAENEDGEIFSAFDTSAIEFGYTD